MTVSPLHDDPPPTEPGMVSVDLDPHGRLERLIVVPPEQDVAAPLGTEPDWSAAFKAADLDLASLKPVEPQWNPPIGADRRAAWAGACPDDPTVPIRIEAAAYRGRPVFFRVIYPWTMPTGALEARTSLPLRVSAAMLSGLVLIVLFAAGLIARRNVRLGRGDRKGAFRLALLMFALGSVAALLKGHYVASADMIGRTLLSNVFPLFIAAAVWVLYLAMEPYLRRIWPQTIVSWVRLLDGRVRDPLVAGHVLVGLVFGVALRLLDQSYQLLCERLGLASGLSDMFSGPPIDVALAGLSDMRGAVSNLFVCTVAALILPLGTILLLLLFRMALRRDWLAIVTWTIVGSVTAVPPGFNPVALILWGTAGSALFLVALFRFGLVTVWAAVLTAILLAAFPLTPDPSSWYFTRTLLVLVMLGTIAWLGFRLAVVGAQAKRLAAAAQMTS